MNKSKICLILFSIYYLRLYMCIHLCIQKFNVSICVNVLVFLSCTLKIIRIKFNINFQTHSLYKDYLHSQVIRRTLKNNTFSFTFYKFPKHAKIKISIFFHVKECIFSLLDTFYNAKFMKILTHSIRTYYQMIVLCNKICTYNCG